MADPYIDQYETLSYGPFAIRQIQELLIGLDPDFDAVLEAIVRRIEAATAGVAQALRDTGDTTAIGGPRGLNEDVVSQARGALRRLAAYLEARQSGPQLLQRLFGHEPVLTVTSRHPSKLLGTIGRALHLLIEEQDLLPEYHVWVEELRVTQQGLLTLEQRMRETRVAPREMAPAVRTARATWLKIYEAAKPLVETVLRLHDLLHLMPDVFDDLADVHCAPGVTDELPAPSPDEAR
ncbi:MAG TPA: hypothetical protein VH877_25835 [Polyangia bacterium]|nr:hypothetical protein [Polyangia bacterium]